MKNKRSLIVGLCLICLLFAVPALAAQKTYKTGIYVSGKVIGNYQTHKVTGSINGESIGSMGDKDDGGFGGAIAVGYDFYRDLDIHLRMEIEYSYNSKTKASESAYGSIGGVDVGLSDKVEMGIQTAFINAYYDFETGTMFTPYIGGGVGLAFIDAKGSMNFNVGGYEIGGSTSKMNTNFAWNIGAGVGVNLSESVTLDAGYRFVSVGTAKTGTANYGPLAIKGKAKNIYLHQFYVCAMNFSLI